MIDKYKLMTEGPDKDCYIWDGELDEDKQFADAIELSLAIWDFVLPFLLTCEDPIGVLQTAMDFVVEDAVQWLPMSNWAENYRTTTTPEKMLHMLMTRTYITYPSEPLAGQVVHPDKAPSA